MNHRKKYALITAAAALLLVLCTVFCQAAPALTAQQDGETAAAAVNESVTGETVPAEESTGIKK